MSRSARPKIKSRDNIFLVQRYMTDAQETPIAAFRTLEAAELYAGACQQEFVDNGYNPDSVRFIVSIVSFYDE